MEKIIKGVMFVVLLVYVVSPIDLVPGPIDDAIAVLLYIVANAGMSKFKQLKHSSQTTESN